MAKKKATVGSSLDDFLMEQGTLDETTAVAVKRVLAWQLKQAMEKEKMSKLQMAKLMNTSRSQLDRILDPECDKIQLNTLVGAARVLGRQLRIELV